MRVSRLFGILLLGALLTVWGGPMAQAKTFTKGEVSFTLADELADKYPELVDLILATESMDDNERQYWFDIMPSMTEAQIDRLFDILETERRKLAELEVKYQSEIAQINNKHLMELQISNIKASFKNTPESAAKLFIPVMDLSALPPVSLRRFASFEAIPTIDMPFGMTLAEGAPSEDKPSVPAIAVAEVYDALGKAGLLNEKSDFVMIQYALELAGDAEGYRAFLGEEGLKAYVELGARLAKDSARDAELAKILAAFPDYDLNRLVVVSNPRTIIDTNVPKLQAILAADEPAFFDIFRITHDLVPFRYRSECNEECQNAIDAGLEFLVAGRAGNGEDAVALISGSTAPTRFLYGRSFDFMSFYAVDQRQREALAALGARALSATLDADREAPVMSGPEDVAPFVDIILRELGQNGKWKTTAKEHETYWYRSLALAYREGWLPELYDALRLEVFNRGDLATLDRLRLDGPLIEALANSVIGAMRDGTCRKAPARYDTMLRDGLWIGNVRTSSAYTYMELPMVRALTDPAIFQTYCGTYVPPQPQLASNHFKAIIIGASEPLGSEYEPLGDIPRNDAQSLADVLEADGIRWEITSKLLGQEATKRKVLEVISSALSKAGQDDNILIYFSGHGHGSAFLADDSDYLVTPDSTDPTGDIRVGHIKDMMSRSHAGRIALVIDACRDDALPPPLELVSKGSAKAAQDSAKIEEINRAVGEAASVVYSTARGDLSSANRKLGYSDFTSAFVSALRGPGDQDGDGRVTLAEAVLQTILDMKQLDAGQRPDIEELEGRMNWVISEPPALADRRH